MEGEIPNAGDAVGDGDRCQIETATEGAMLNASNALWNNYKAQAAVTEGVIPDCCDTVRDDDRCQVATATEGAFPNAGDALWDGNGC